MKTEKDKIKNKIISEIEKYDWEYKTGEGFFEDNFLYNFRQMYKAVKKIKQWQFKLRNGK